MKREYNMNPDEWKLIFNAPLTSDLNEIIHSIAGTSNANIHTFDADKGLHIKTTSVGQYGVKYTLPQSFNATACYSNIYFTIRGCMLINGIIIHLYHRR